MISEAKAKGNLLYIATLDTEKAFDVVSHNSVLCKLFYDNVPLEEWLLLQDMYQNLTTKIKWAGDLSSTSFNLTQGVRQGGVLSTTHYKRFNNQLLLDLENNNRGMMIGSINILHSTCADDLLLASENDMHVQSMLVQVEEYSHKERFNINPTKSKVIVINSKKLPLPTEFTFESKPLPCRMLMKWNIWA